MSYIKIISRKLSEKMGLIIPSVVFVILIYGIYREWDGLKHYSWSINPLYIFLSFIAYTCQLVLMFLIWHIIMTKLVGHGNFNVNINAFFYSSLAKRIPTIIPFLGVRFQVYKNNLQSKTSYVMIGSLLEILVLIIAGGFFISLIGLMIDSTVLPFFITLTISIVTLLFVLYPKGFTSLLNLIYKKFRFESNANPINPRILFSLIGISLSTYIFNSIAIFLLIIGITNQPISFQGTVIAASLYYLLTYVTMYLMGGFGIKEIVFGLFMRQYMVFPIGVLFALLIRLMMIVVESIAYVIVQQTNKREKIPGQRNLE